MEETRHCPYCDEVIRYNAVKCKHCGSLLTNSPGIPTGVITPETQVKIALSSKYEILEEIGRGGMASVYKAVQKNLNRPVALKVIHQNLIYDSEFVQRFHQEAQLCASLNHPNIVTIHDEGAINNVHYMAMEYLSGNDLQRIVKYNGKIVIEDTIKIIISVANALDYAHSKGLIHRDIKCANILLTTEGRAVLTDFGIAFAANTSKLTQTGSVIGTPEYMSPEQAKGIITDGRSDIYSLCIVLYECLTGKVPFTGDNPLTTIFRIINEKPLDVRELNKEIPSWLSSIINKGLEKEPQKRYQTGRQLAQALINKKPATIEVKNKLWFNTISGSVKPQGFYKSKVKINIKSLSKNIFQYRVFYITLAAGLLSFLASQIFFKENLTSVDNLVADTKVNSSLDTIDILLKTADNLYSTGNLVYPDDNNAYLFYTDVLNIDSHNQRAIEGLDNIQKYFLEIADLEYENRNYKNAIAVADSGLNFFKDNSDLLEIKSSAELKLGEKPTSVASVLVPSVIGLQLSAAQEIIRLNNLGVGSISRIFSADKKNIVINQIPGSGTLLNSGGKINLIIGE